MSIKKYTSFVDTSYRRMLCNAEGHVLRPMTKEEEREWDHTAENYMILTDEELEKGNEEIGDW